MNREGPFPAIRDALDRARDEGRAIRFWWRDDDAVRHTPALDRLLALSSRSATPITLAVIPARAEPSLAERLHEERAVTVAVHGWSHANHAPAGQKPAEFGAHRPIATMAVEAARARAHLADLFPAAELALFVPPWNRIATALGPALLEAGFRGVSGFGAGAPGRGASEPNTHVDPVDWRGTRGVLAPARIEAAFVAAAAQHDSVGLLTHHLCFDEALWDVTQRLLDLVARHPAVDRVAAGDLLPIGDTGSNPDAARDLSSRSSISAECRP